MPVRHKAFQPPDAHAFALDTAHTLAFALALLRTHTAADGRQRGGSAEHLVSAFEILIGDMLYEAGDVNAHGTGGDAGLVLAVQAALGLVDSHLRRVTQRDLVKVGIADMRLL